MPTSFCTSCPPSCRRGGHSRSRRSELDRHPDYTVSWAPEALAGVDRDDAVAGVDEGPTLFLNVGARSYRSLFPDDLATDISAADATHDGDVLSLDFELTGIPVSVGGRGVTEDELAAFAMSLRDTDHDRWRAELSDRLFVDDPS